MMLRMIRKSLWKRAFVCSIILLSLLSCNPSKKTIIEEMECDPPCWQNIIPGVTSEQEALDIIKNLPNVDPESVAFRRSTYQIFGRELVFTLKPDGINGIVDISKDKVIRIYLYNNLNVTINQAFSQLGEPDYLINLITQMDYGHGYGEENYLNAISPDRGISIDYFTSKQPYWNRRKIGPNTKINSITFFEPNSFKSLDDIGLFSLGHPIRSANRDILIPWNGYGDLEKNYPPYKFYSKRNRG